MKWHLEFLTPERTKKIFESKILKIFIAVNIILLAVLIMNLYLLNGVKAKHGTFKENYLAKLDNKNVNAESIRNEFIRINGLIDRKNFSWSRFLSRLEGAAVAKVSISSINPSFSDGNVRLEGVAFSIDELVRFMKNLQNSEYFSNVFMAEQKNSASGNITFVITFKYADSK